MVGYIKHNVNPKGRLTGDCTTRALVSCLGISYLDALKYQFRYAAQTSYDPTSKQVVELILKEFGYKKMKQPRKFDNRKYKVLELDDLLSSKNMQDGVFVTIANHHTCIKNNNVIDIWDCRDKTVGNYYIKE